MWREAARQHLFPSFPTLKIDLQSYAHWFPKKDSLFVFVLFCNQSRIFSNFIIPISCRDLQSEKRSTIPLSRISGSICVIDGHERETESWKPTSQKSGDRALGVRDSTGRQFQDLRAQILIFFLLTSSSSFLPCFVRERTIHS